MKEKQYIIFDFDGTLFDSQTGIKNAIQYALRIEGIEEKNEDLLQSFIGPPLHKSFADNYGFDKPKIDELVKNLRVYYADKGYLETQLYTGVKELLLSLKQKNKTLAIATAKPTKFAKQILANFEFTHLFSSVHGSLSKGELFPKDRVIGSVLKDLELFDTEDCVMIGDTLYDIKGAQAHEMQSIAVTYGYGKAKDLHDARATLLVNSVAELKQVLL